MCYVSGSVSALLPVHVKQNLPTARGTPQAGKRGSLQKQLWLCLGTENARDRENSPWMVENQGWRVGSGKGHQHIKASKLQAGQAVSSQVHLADDLMTQR